jgi:hypothetical protein
VPRSRRAALADDTIRGALEECEGNRSAAAHKLGISPRTLQRWIQNNPLLRLSREDLDLHQTLQVVMAHYDRAISGHFPSQKWWLKRYARWCENPLQALKPLRPTKIIAIRWESRPTPAGFDERAAAKLAKRRIPRVTTGFRICSRTGRIRKTTSRDPQAKWIGLQFSE